MANDPIDALRRRLDHVPPSAPPHEPTRPGGLTPAPGSVAPPRSISPSPESAAVRVKMGDVDVKVGRVLGSRLRAWAVPLALSLAGGLVLGYYQGLKAAGVRMRANEARVLELTAQVEELRSAMDARDKSLAASIGRAHTLADDHEARLNRLEPSAKLLGERLNDLAKQRPIIVKRSE